MITRHHNLTFETRCWTRGQSRSDWRETPAGTVSILGAAGFIFSTSFMGSMIYGVGFHRGRHNSQQFWGAFMV